MSAPSKTYAETYAMRSRFFQLLGEAGKMLADAYREADLDNQAAIKDLAFDAMRHSLIEHHGYAAEELNPRIDPLEVLAFVESGMSMTGKQIAARWPEWSKLMDAAMSRYESESSEYRLKWKTTADGTSDPMVNSMAAARHHWVYLPLIREALAKVS